MKKEEDSEKMNRVYIGIGVAVVLAALVWICAAVLRQERTAVREDTKGSEAADPFSDRTAAPDPEERDESRTEMPVSPAVFPTAETDKPTADNSAAANAGREAPRADPRMPGYSFDPQATDELYLLFASENTNNTDGSSPYRSLSKDYKKRLDRLCRQFASEPMDAGVLEPMLLQADFSWPDEPSGVRHSLQNVKIAEYHYSGRDMSVVKERILFTNLSGRHYLFLQVFFSESENAVHVIMINGMIR